MDKTELTQVIRAYRRDAGGEWQPVAVPASPAARPWLSRVTVTRLAALMLPILAGAALYYGLSTVRPAPTATVMPAAIEQHEPQAAPTATLDAQQRLLNRDCVYPSAPQGTVIRGYYTDASGQSRDAICRADGWKATED